MCILISNGIVERMLGKQVQEKDPEGVKLKKRR